MSHHLAKCFNKGIPLFKLANPLSCNTVTRKKWKRKRLKNSKMNQNRILGGEELSSELEIDPEEFENAVRDHAIYLGMP